MSTRKSINGKMLTLEEAYEKHKGLIHDTAFQLRLSGKKAKLEKDELVSAGKIGFIQAYNVFDENKGFKFSSCAIPYITGHIRMEIRRNNPGLHFTEEIKALAGRYTKAGFTEKDVPSIMNNLQVDYFKAYELFEYMERQNYVSLEKKLTHKKEALRIKDCYGKHQDYSSVFVQNYRSLLTDLEQEVFDLLAQGYIQSDIKHILGLKHSTIAMRVKKIRKKLAHIQGVS
jgi:RNA polymerase sporulation-specific sigma factor